MMKDGGIFRRIEAGPYECYFGDEDVIGRVRRDDRRWVAILPNGAERGDFATRVGAYGALRDTRTGGRRRMNAKGWMGVSEGDWLRDWGAYWKVTSPLPTTPIRAVSVQL